MADPLFDDLMKQVEDHEATVSMIMGDDATGPEGDSPIGPEQAEDLGPMAPEDVQSSVRLMIDEAVEFSESELSHERIRTQRYYNGQVDFPAEDGRSKVVVSKVRDTVRHQMAAVMRVFMQSPQVVEFQPFSEDDVQLAKDVTSYCNDVFNNKNDGYRQLYNAASDSLVKKIGIIKVWWDDEPKRVVNEMEEVDEMTMHRILQLPNAEITERFDNDDGTFDITVVREFPKGQVRLEAIAPENFHVNRQARNEQDAFIMVHRENKRVSDLVAMGFEYEDVINFSQEDNSTTDVEDDYRREYVARNRDETEISNDMSSKPVLVTDTYIHLDVDGDGIGELKHFITAGPYHEILFEETVDEFPFAIFYGEIEPHAFFPRCLADMTIQDQDAATSLIRSVLDNAQLSNNPQREIDETAANIEDAMNAEIGALIRTRKMNSVRDLAVPFIGGQTLPVMQYLDDMSAMRSGVNAATAGMHPDVMQSTTKAAVSATVNAAQSMGEMICRNLAETGMTRLFRLILHLTIREAKGQVHVRQGATFKTFDPRLWHSDLDMDVNVGLGTGQVDEKMQMLNMIADKQESIFSHFGPNNPFAGWQNLRHTYVQQLALMGFKDAAAYFPEWGPEQAQAWQQQQQQQQQNAQQNNEMAGLIQVEREKNQGKMQIDAAKLQGQMQRDQAQIAADMAKARMEDDRKRDADAMDFAVDSAEVEAKYGAQIQRDLVNAEVTRERDYRQYGPGNSGPDQTR